jgi:hypothetical protein
MRSGAIYNQTHDRVNCRGSVGRRRFELPGPGLRTCWEALTNLAFRSRWSRSLVPTYPPSCARKFAASGAAHDPGLVRCFPPYNEKRAKENRRDWHCCGGGTRFFGGATRWGSAKSCANLPQRRIPRLCGNEQETNPANQGPSDRIMPAAVALTGDS